MYPSIESSQAFSWNFLCFGLTSVMAMIEALILKLWIRSLSSSILFRNWSALVYHTDSGRSLFLITLPTLCTLGWFSSRLLDLVVDEPLPICNSRHVSSNCRGRLLCSFSVFSFSFSVFLVQFFSLSTHLFLLAWG